MYSSSDDAGTKDTCRHQEGTAKQQQVVLVDVLTTPQMLQTWSAWLLHREVFTGSGQVRSGILHLAIALNRLLCRDKLDPAHHTKLRGADVTTAANAVVTCDQHCVLSNHEERSLGRE